MDDGIQIDLTLRHHDDAEQEVRMSFFIVARVDGQFSHILDIEQAVNADASSFMHDLPSSHQQVLSSEILAGLLTGKRRDKDRQRGWYVELRGHWACTAASHATLAMLPPLHSRLVRV